LNNKTYFVFAKKGETYYDIAVDVQLTVSQLRKYNDVKQRNYRPKENEIVYIAKKAKSNQYVGTHIVAIGESLRDIAQRYGVREKSLRRLNNLSKDSRIPSGTTIMLK
jgi:LysM repeat protein